MTQRSGIFILLTILLLLSIGLMTVIRALMPPVRDLQQIYKDSTLNVVSEKNDEVQYELCQYIGKRSGLQVKYFVENDLNKSVNGLEENRYDIIARNIPVTTESRKRFTFTTPVKKNRQMLAQRKPEKTDTIKPLRNQIDLAGKTVYLPKYSSAKLRLEHLSEEIAEPIHIVESNYSPVELLEILNRREIDFAVIDRSVTEKNEKNFPNLDFKTDISFTFLQAWAVRSTSPVLLDSLNVWINDFANDK